MIKHTQNISINSDSNKAWSYLIDFSKSLIFDKYFILVEIPGKYSVNYDYTFYAKVKYLFNTYDMKASIIENIPPEKITIKFMDKNNSNIYLIKSFEIKSYGNSIILNYQNQLCLNSFYKSTLLYSNIKASCIGELIYLKKAIESSDFIDDGEKVKTLLH